MEAKTSKNNLRPFIWVILAITAAGGYYFLKGSKAFDRNHDYYAYFTDVQGLQPASPVNIKGVRVGKIADINIDSSGQVKVLITVKNNVILHSGTVAKLAPGGITGDKIIDILPGNGPGILPANTVLPTTLDTSLLPVSVRFTPVFEAAKYLLKSTDSVLLGLNAFFGNGYINKTTTAVANFEQQSKNVADASSEWNNNANNIVTSINNASVSIQKTAAGEGNVNNSIDNANNKMAAFAAKNTRQKITNIQTSLKNLGRSFHKLDTSLSGLGKALNDKQSYSKSVNSFDTLNQNWQKLQKNPPGISIFGGKKKK